MLRSNGPGFAVSAWKYHKPYTGSILNYNCVSHKPGNMRLFKSNGFFLFTCYRES